MRKILYFLIAMSALIACNLEQEIELDLPAYEERVVVEGYLDAGQPYRLLLTRSSSYFSPFPTDLQETFSQLLVNDAQVRIRYQGETIELQNLPTIDPETNKVYNYISDQIVPFDTINPFELEILLDDGRTIESQSRFLPVIPIDSIVTQFREETNSEVDSARVLTYFNDRPGQANFFRRTLYVQRQGVLEELQNFTADDRFVEDVIVFGTAYEFAPGDTILNRLYHIEEPYYRFLTSLEAAAASNGNPFGQPSPIVPAVGGTADAIGIFTCLSYAEEVTIVEE